MIKIKHLWGSSIAVAFSLSMAACTAQTPSIHETVSRQQATSSSQPTGPQSHQTVMNHCAEMVSLVQQGEVLTPQMQEILFRCNTMTESNMQGALGMSHEATMRHCAEMQSRVQQGDRLSAKMQDVLNRCLRM